MVKMVIILTILVGIFVATQGVLEIFLVLNHAQGFLYPDMYSTFQSIQVLLLS